MALFDNVKRPSRQPKQASEIEIRELGLIVVNAKTCIAAIMAGKTEEDQLHALADFARFAYQKGKDVALKIVEEKISGKFDDALADALAAAGRA